MLQPGSEVRALTVERIMSFSTDQKRAFGETEQAWQSSLGATTMFMGAMMCKKQAKCFAFHLDSDKVTAAKKGAAEGVDYVSTNDVLTSAFFNTCGARVAWMGFDCRDKGLPGIGADLAGNYVTALVLGPEVFATPATMRQMYTPGQPYVTAQVSKQLASYSLHSSTKRPVFTTPRSPLLFSFLISALVVVILLRSLLTQALFLLLSSSLLLSSHMF